MTGQGETRGGSGGLGPRWVRPRFSRAVTVLLLAGLAALWGRGLWTREERQTDPEVMRAYAERMLYLAEVQSGEPALAQVLAGTSDESDLGRTLCGPYARALVRLDDSGRLQAAITHARFGDPARALEILAGVTGEEYRPLRRYLECWWRGEERPAELREEVGEAVFVSDTWWGWHLRRGLPELGLAAEADEILHARGQNQFRHALWAGGVRWAILLAAAACFAGSFFFAKPARALRRDRSWRWARHWGGWLVAGALARSTALFFALAYAGYWALGDALDRHLLVLTVESLGRALPILLLVHWLFAGPAGFVRALGLEPARLAGSTVWRYTAAAVLLGAGADWLVAYLVRLVPRYAVGDFIDPTFFYAGPWLLLSQLVVAALVAPVSEEIVFRGVMLPFFRRGLAAPLAALLTTGLFVAAHPYSLHGAVAVFFSGLILAWLFLRTGSLWPAILFHALGNGASTLAAWWLFSRPL